MTTLLSGAVLSRPALVVAGSALSVGLLSGLGLYLGRSDHVDPQVPGTAAWIPHLIIAVVVAVWFTVAVRRSPLGAKVLLAPLGRPIASRIAATFRPRAQLRCVVVGFLVFVEVYSVWRAAAQVFAGLDPNFVRNAWGGPSYLGAMACHYLDCALIIASCHLFLRAATLPASRR